MPVAVNCCCRPSGTLAFVGVTAILTSEAPVTVKSVEPETAPNVAVMVAVPAVNPEATP